METISLILEAGKNGNDDLVGYIDGVGKYTASLTHVGSDRALYEWSYDCEEFSESGTISRNFDSTSNFSIWFFSGGSIDGIKFSMNALCKDSVIVCLGDTKLYTLVHFEADSDVEAYRWYYESNECAVLYLPSFVDFFKSLMRLRFAESRRCFNCRGEIQFTPTDQQSAVNEIQIIMLVSLFFLTVYHPFSEPPS